MNQEDVPEAYENLINDALRGDPTFFAHWDEVELAWKWVQPILNAFEENLVPLILMQQVLLDLPSRMLLARDGNHWWLDEKQEQTFKTERRYAYLANH